MSHFSTELQLLLESMPGSRAGFAGRVSIAPSTFHNYFHGSAPPTVDDLEKICSILEHSQRAQLAIAHLRDQTPPSAADLVRVVNLINEPRVREETEAEYATIKLPAAVRRNFEFLMRRAVDSAAVRDSVAATVKLMRGD